MRRNKSTPDNAWSKWLDLLKQVAAADAEIRIFKPISLHT
jgi:hypothetical protein